MSTQTEAMSKKGTDPAGEAAAAVPEGLAEQLVAQAKASGVALTGPGGLLSGVDEAGAGDRVERGDDRASRARARRHP